MALLIVVFEFVVGKIPDGLTLDHFSLQPTRVCQPGSPEVVTLAENSRRLWRAGRGNGCSGSRSDTLQARYEFRPRTPYRESRQARLPYLQTNEREGTTKCLICGAILDEALLEDPVAAALVKNPAKAVDLGAQGPTPTRPTLRSTRSMQRSCLLISLRSGRPTTETTDDANGRRRARSCARRSGPLGGERHHEKDPRYTHSSRCLLALPVLALAEGENTTLARPLCSSSSGRWCIPAPVVSYASSITQRLGRAKGQGSHLIAAAAVSGAITQAITNGTVGFNDATFQLVVTAVIAAISTHFGFWETVYDLDLARAAVATSKRRTDMEYKKHDVVAQVAEAADVSNATAERVLDAFFVDIANAGVEGGDVIGPPGLGKFESVETSARKGRNPHTGEEIYAIPGSYRVRSRGQAL